MTFPSLIPQENKPEVITSTGTIMNQTDTKKLLELQKWINQNIEHYETLRVMGKLFPHEQDYQDAFKSFKDKIAELSLSTTSEGSKPDIGCKCQNEIKTGTTTIACCNICGLPTEEFWTKQAPSPGKEREELKKAEDRLLDGREYLMTVQPKDLTVGDCLEAFGFNRNGIGSR